VKKYDKTGEVYVKMNSNMYYNAYDMFTSYLDILMIKTIM